ncbi:glutamate-5-semialdehyde dehydrogenase [Carboxylicivirga mesophila]|uniref:Gamma-glutamyl phosphate reductase n=1 Tax=Carboxylicivirga mesophila TaxID=1166478 RepID=A0ABS5K9X5_9BACT|nr:glutamate-5-semialdehyde dehydrogenase [Carboxylicivirga mesophila]MBS2211682.1 glutamate-5-semialdehyde dehydrogenase [Carboxylicivirga mesophila]
MYQAYFEKVKQASRELTRLSADKTAAVLEELSHMLKNSVADILTANQKDLDRMDEADPKYDRLKLTAERIEGIADALLNVANLPCPVGDILEERKLDNGLELKKIRVALGVVGVIYEARPNVTIDVFALCLRSGNACVLKGGSDAEYSNEVLVNIIHSVLKQMQINPDIVQLLPADRKATDALMAAVGYVDVLIPRGSQGLINSVRDNAKLPVIETGAGIVHTYFDASGNMELGQKVVFNAKTRRVSVCNALDCLVLHKSRLNDLPVLVKPMAEKHVVIYADEEAYEHLQNVYPDALLKKAAADDFGTEFLSHKLAIKTVESFDEALDHIYKYSSKHSEAIIAEDQDVIERYLNEVDAAAVYVNASTAFTDGAQFGLGAEIGISTQKLHARGPMGLQELTSYKWIVLGEGQVRPA